MKSNICLIIILTLWGTSLSAQDARRDLRDTLKNNITVINYYKPHVERVTKMKFAPLSVQEEENVFRPKFSYDLSLSPHPYSISPDSTRLPHLDITYPPKPENTRWHILAGMGTLVNPILDASFFSPSDKFFYAYGGRIIHRSMWYSKFAPIPIENSADSHAYRPEYSYTLAEISLFHSSEEVSQNLNLSYEHNLYHYYGSGFRGGASTRLRPVDSHAANNQQETHRLRADFHIENHPELEAIKLKAFLRGELFNTAGNIDALLFHSDVALKRAWGNKLLHVDVSFAAMGESGVDVPNERNDTVPTDIVRWYLYTHPSFQWKHPLFHMGVGAQLGILVNAGNKVQPLVTPSLFFHFFPARERVISFRAEMGGKLTYLSYSDIMKKSPFLSPSQYFYSEYEKFHIKLIAMGHIDKYTSWYLEAKQAWGSSLFSYSLFRESNLYHLNQTDMTHQSISANISHYGARADYHTTARFRIASEQEKLSQIPLYMVESQGRYRLFRKLDMLANINLYGEQNIIIYGKTVVAQKVSKPIVFDFKVGPSYHINSQWQIWLAVQNYLREGDNRWYNYQTQTISVAGGIRYLSK